jgi:hypothetical protein
MSKNVDVDIKTGDDGAIQSVTYTDIKTGKQKKLNKFTHPKGAPPPGVPQPPVDVELQEFTETEPSHYCVIDPTTGNLWCIDIP